MRSGCAFQAGIAASQGKAASIRGVQANDAQSGSHLAEVPAGYWQTVTVLTDQPSPLCQNLRRPREQERRSGSPTLQSAAGTIAEAGAATGASRGAGAISRMRAGCPRAGAASSGPQNARASTARSPPERLRRGKARKAVSPRTSNGQAYVIHSPQFSTMLGPVFSGTAALSLDPVKRPGTRRSRARRGRCFGGTVAQ